MIFVKIETTFHIEWNLKHWHEYSTMIWAGIFIIILILRQEVKLKTKCKLQNPLVQSFLNCHGITCDHHSYIQYHICSLSIFPVTFTDDDLDFISILHLNQYLQFPHCKWYFTELMSLIHLNMTLSPPTRRLFLSDRTNWQLTMNTKRRKNNFLLHSSHL